MKTCPICKATLFADMEICYGCMYRFGSKPELEEAMSAEGVRDEETGGEAAEGVEASSATASPAGKAGTVGPGQWTVRIEMRNGSDPDQAWSIELAPPFEPKPKDGAACVAIGD